MTNPPRQKGTRWETEMLPDLRATFGPQVERAPLKGIHDHGDYCGVPVAVEAKSTLAPRFLEWARVLEKKTAGKWVLLWHGDRRKPPGALAVLPYDFALEILAHWHNTFPMPSECETE